MSCTFQPSGRQSFPSTISSVSVLEPSTKSEPSSELSSIYPPLSFLFEGLDSVPSTSDIYTSTATSSSSLRSMSSRSVLTPSIKFAPLPDIGPRKRRSSQPLGVAARSKLIRQRRGLQRQNGRLVALKEPLRTRVEMEEHRLRVEVLAARNAQSQASANAQEVILQIIHGDDGDDDDGDDNKETTRKTRTQEDADDPLLVLGKMFKNARKTIWRNILKEKAEDEGRRMRKQMRSRKADVGPCAPILLKPATPPPSVPPLHFQGTVSLSEGRMEVEHQGRPREDCETQSESVPNVALIFPSSSSPAEPPARPTSPPLPEIFNKISISA